MKEIGAPVDMAKEIREGAEWPEPEVSVGAQPEESPMLQAALPIDGSAVVQRDGIYSTDLPYYPEMVEADRPEVGRVLPSFYAEILDPSGTPEFRLTPGVVFHQNIGGDSGGAGSGVLYPTYPTLGGVALTNDPAPTGTAVEGKLFVHVSTTPKGVISSVPTIEMVATVDLPKDSTHHRPADPVNVGVDGDYWFELAEFAVDGGNLVVDSRLPGNRNIPNQLVEMTNIGSGVSFYNQYVGGNTDQHEFRKLDGRDSYTGDSPDAGTTEQIQVVNDGVQNRVIGNGKKGNLTISPYSGSDIEVDWNDGLTETSGDQSIDIPGGIDQVIGINDGCVGYHELTFTNGSLTAYTFTP